MGQRSTARVIDRAASNAAGSVRLAEAMSASERTDCYLCGAPNELQADQCVRCDGQLLKLPSESLGLAAHDAANLIVDDVPDVEEDIVQRPRQRRPQSGSVEDRRLSEALGMKSYEHIDTVVTSVPHATQSANIPFIGTRTGRVPQAAMHAKEVGVRTYVLLFMLVLATASLGWSTLGEDDADPTPDNLAFTVSTLPIQSTTTTVAQRREWSEAEAVGNYGAAFTDVRLYDCPSETPEGATVNVEPLDDVWTSGIAVDEHNVILNGSDLRTANVAVIRARNGARRFAILQGGPRGTRIATTNSTISRHLDLETPPDGDATFHLTYDEETNAVDSSDVPAGGPIEITVTSVGDVREITIGSAQVAFSDLLGIDRLVEPIEDEDAPLPKTLCDHASRLADTRDPLANDKTEAR